MTSDRNSRVQPTAAAYPARCRTSPRGILRGRWHMTKVEEIEREIEKLSPDERRRLRNWILEIDAEHWDNEIEADVAAGRLDALAQEALEEHRAGKTKPI